MRAGVSTRGVEVPVESAANVVVNAAGEATTTLIGDLVEKHGGSVGALACILEGIMLNVAWQLWANTGGESSPEEFTAAFLKLAGAAAEEVAKEIADTKNPAG